MTDWERDCNIIKGKYQRLKFLTNTLNDHKTILPRGAIETLERYHVSYKDLEDQMSESSFERGGQGSIHDALDKDHVIKKIKTSNINQTMCEIYAHSLSLEGVIPLKQWGMEMLETNQYNVLIKFPKMEGSLDALMKRSTSWESLLSMVRSSVQGLQSLHRHGIIHRDVKFSNLLFSKDTVMWGDLGCCQVDKRCYSACGTDKYSPWWIFRSPTGLPKNCRVDERYDYYSVCYMMLTCLVNIYPTMTDLLKNIRNSLWGIIQLIYDSPDNEIGHIDDWKMVFWGLSGMEGRTQFNANIQSIYIEFDNQYIVSKKRKRNAVPSTPKRTRGAPGTRQNFSQMATPIMKL